MNPRDELLELHKKIDQLEKEKRSLKQDYRELEIALSFEKRSLLAALSELKNAHERLGPAGYKWLERLKLAEEVCNSLRGSHEADHISASTEIALKKWLEFK